MGALARSFAETLRGYFEKINTLGQQGRLFVSGMPWEFLQRIFEEWQKQVPNGIVGSTQIPCYLVTLRPSSAQVKIISPNKVLSPSYLVAERRGSQLILVDPDSNKDVADSVRGAGGTVLEVWKEGFPWEDSEVQGFKWNHLIESWLTELGVPQATLRDHMHIVDEFKDDIVTVRTRALTLLERLDSFPSSAGAPSFYEDLAFHLGFARPGPSSHSVEDNRGLMHTFWEHSREKGLQVYVQMLKGDVKNTPIASQPAQTKLVMDSLDRISDTYLKAGQDDQNSPLLHWRAMTASNRADWDVLTEDVFRGLLERPKHLQIQISSLQLEFETPAQLLEVAGASGKADTWFLIRDPSRPIDCVVSWEVNAALQRNLQSGATPRWDVFGHIASGKSTTTDVPFGQRPTASLTIPTVDPARFNGKHVMWLTAGPSLNSNAPRSRSAQIWEPCREMPFLMLVDGAEFEPPEVHREDLALDQELEIPSEGTYRLRALLFGGASNFAVDNLPQWQFNSLALANAGSNLAGFEITGYFAEWQEIKLRWQDLDGKQWSANIRVSLKDESTYNHKSLTEWLMADLSRDEAPGIKKILRGLREQQPSLIASGSLRVSPPANPLSTLEKEVLQRKDGWLPIIVPDDRMPSALDLELRAERVRFDKRLSLHPQANRWRVAIEASAGEPPGAKLASYEDARETILKTIEQLFIAPLRREEATKANLAREGFLGLVARDSIKEYLNRYVDLLRHADNLRPDNPQFIQHLCADSILVFRQNGLKPRAILLTPFHPLVLGRIFLIQTNGIRRLDAGKRTSFERLLLEQPIPAWGTVLNATLTPSPAVAVQSGDPHWALLFPPEELQTLPGGDFVGWLRTIGLSPAIGPLGLSPSALREAVENYLEAYPSRRALVIRLADDSSPRETEAEIQSLIYDDDKQKRTSVGKKLPGGLAVFDSRALPDNPLEYERQYPLYWFRGNQGEADISTPPRPSTASLVDPGQTYAAAPAILPILRRPLFQSWISDTAPTKQTFQTFSRTPNQNLDSGSLEHAYFEALLEFEGQLSRAMEWGTSLGDLRANWQVCSGSQADPRIFVDFASRQPETALWSYRLFGRGAGREGPDPVHGHFILARVSPVFLSVIDQLLDQFLLGAGLGPEDVLRELGEAGLALGDEFIRTGRRAEGALGLFLCQRIVWQPPGHAAPLPHYTSKSDNTIDSCGFLIQLDPFFDVFRKVVNERDASSLVSIGTKNPEVPIDEGMMDLASQTGATHADLVAFHLVFCSEEEGKERLWIKPVAIESKFRSGQQTPEWAGQMLTQASATAKQLDRLLEVCLDPDSHAERALLAEVIHLGLRLSAGSFYQGAPERKGDWGSFERRVLEALMAGEFKRADARPLVVVHHEGPTFNGLGNSPQSPVIMVSLADWRSKFQGKTQPSIDRVVSDLTSYLRYSCLRGIAPTTPPGAPTPSTVAATSPEPHPAVPEGKEPTAPPSPPSATTVQAPLPPTSATTDRQESDMPGPPRDLQEAHERVKGVFEDFVGNSGAIDRLSVDLVDARTKKPPYLPSAYLLTGNPSTGKTFLAGKIAEALDIPFVHLDGKAAASREKIVEAVDGALRAHGLKAHRLASEPQGIPEWEYPALVVFIDEIHLIPGKSQEELLTLTEAHGRYVRLSDRICRFPRATFIAATTRSTELDKALRTRFQPEIHLEDYSENEIAEILGRHFPEIPEENRVAVAILAQSVPRVSIRLAADLIRRRQVSLDPNKTWEKHLADLRKAEHLDPLGLGRRHYKVLEILANHAKPIGVDQLVDLVGEIDREIVEHEVLLGLQRMGLVEVQATAGRSITEKGRNYLRNNPRP